MIETLLPPRSDTGTVPKDAEEVDLSEFSENMPTGRESNTGEAYDEDDSGRGIRGHPLQCAQQ